MGRYSGHDNKAQFTSKQADKAVFKMITQGYGTARKYKCRVCAAYHVTSGALANWVDPWEILRQRHVEIARHLKGGLDSAAEKGQEKQCTK